MGRPDRLLLAGKTALAAGIAWVVAPLLPFVDSQYAYYAPLGVLASMYPTVARTAAAGLQMLVGLLLGIAVGVLGTLLAQLGAAPVGAVAFVAAFGVLLAGVSSLGEGRSWVPMAALFVLLIGGGSGLEEYSVSYIVHVGFGVVVGLAVNLLLFPPVYLRQASRGLSDLRSSVSDRLYGMADAVVSPSSDARALAEQTDGLTATFDSVRAVVHEANESRRSNPRARGRLDEDELNYSRLGALERCIFLVREVAEGLDRLGSSSPRREMAGAIRSVGHLIDAPPHSDDSEERLERAAESIDELESAVDRSADGRPSAVTVELMIVDSLRRLIDVSRPFVRAADIDAGS